jgi:hypothetical protein
MIVIISNPFLVDHMPKMIDSTSFSPQKIISPVGVMDKIVRLVVTGTFNVMFS